MDVKICLPALYPLRYLVDHLEYRSLSTQSTKIWSNSATSNVKVRLVSAANLTNEDGAETVPMTVKLGDKTLNTTDAEFTGSELFPGSVENGSAVLPLTISQTTKGILKTGQYSGVVSLMLTQATTAEGGA
ncbi:CS1 type fimbrial major subunit [Klebsiella aerogenes]